MRIQLIADDEPACPVAFGKSILHIRRIPASKEREIEAKWRREYALAMRTGDQEAAVAYSVAVEDDKIDYALTGWEKLEGDPACTRENKIKLPPDVKQLIRAIMHNVTPATGDDEANVVTPFASSRPSPAGSDAQI